MRQESVGHFISMSADRKCKGRRSCQIYENITFIVITLCKINEREVETRGWKYDLTNYKLRHYTHFEEHGTAQNFDIVPFRTHRQTDKQTH